MEDVWYIQYSVSMKMMVLEGNINQISSWYRRNRELLRIFEVISLEDDSHGNDELGVGVVDSLGGLEGKGAKSCEDSKKLSLLSRVHLVDNMNNMVVEKMTIIKHSW